MIRLAAIRLVNWYHFADETLRLGGSTVLLGDNGSGKSTVLDAVQWALVADQTQVRFNKAASEQSRRSLYGYVRYKLGSEDETRPGQVRWGRGGCTSHVLLEFADARNPAGDFTCGIAMEATEADPSVARLHVVLPRTPVGEVPAVAEGDLVRTLRDFRAVLRAHPQARVYADAGTYREEIRHRLGTLPEAFHRLIVKALDFRPIGKVRDFVLQYLLDPRDVDTAALQANLEHYKRLEAQARDAERRLGALDAICAQGERIALERRTAESHRYLALRAEVALAEEAVRGVEGRTAEAERDRAVREAELARGGDQLAFLARERDRLTAHLLALPGFREIEALARDLDDTRRAIEEAVDAEARARGILERQAATLELLLSQEARDLRHRHEAFFGADALPGSVEEPAVVARLRQALARDGALGGRDLATWRRRLDQAADAIRVAEFRLRDAAAAARQEGQVLEAEREELERGRHRYPDGPAALLHLLRARLRGAREPRPVCELIEVASPRWRDAVEGYLHTRRFDVIVAPEDFSRALGLYERHKRAYALPGRGEVFIANAGLVDVERVQAAPRRVERRSLAEQVETDDPLARAYVDYLLGDVICCDDEQELRRHRRAITDTVMVYQNHVARQTAPEVFRQHYVGAASRVRRLEEIGRRLAELSGRFVTLARDVEWLAAASAACRRATTEAGDLGHLTETAQRLPDLRARALLLGRQLERIDRKEIEQLEHERRSVEAERARLDARRAELQGALGGLANELRRLAGERAEGLARGERAAQALEAAFGALEPERRASLEARYRQERETRPAAEVREVFDRMHRGIATRIDNLVQHLVHLKTEYANAHGLAGELLGEGYGEFEAERTLWRDSRLPEYRERIGRAKEEAIQQLAEDIIFRLRENLVDVRRQVDELNRALRDVPFGSERYQFTLEVAATHRDFYTLIMEAGHFEKESLFGSAALADGGARRTLAELFDRLVQGEARQVRSELESRADYREYFDYDLRIQHADGSHSFYDRVAGDKSGGETQNPYYVAIFASMYRLYRGLAADGRPRCGLVLLDEAFSKMDEARIQATLAFARALGLQLVMATPKERSDLLAPSVETALYIHRDPVSLVPTVLDFTKEFKPDADVAGRGAAGAAPPPA